MSALPDELWRQILELGIRNAKLTYKDLCCVSITCRRLHRLSTEDSLWSRLLSSDFPNPNPSASSTPASGKSTYKIRFEKERERRLAAHRRVVLRKESEVVERETRIRVIESRVEEEIAKLKASTVELSNLRKVRQASVALNVWQPEVVRGRQRQIVEQCAIPVESRVQSLEMELKLCRQQISALDKACRDEKQRLQMSKEELASMKYHPLQDYSFTNSGDNQCNKRRKKLKETSKMLRQLDILRRLDILTVS